MYICLECGSNFQNPAILQETHGFSTPPYESVCVCPKCKSTSFKEEEIKYCHCCGARLKPTQSIYCSTSCQSRGEKLWQKELAKRALLIDSDLYRLVRETEQYNRENKTRLSYGQYVALVKVKKKGRNKNAKR